MVRIFIKPGLQRTEEIKSSGLVIDDGVGIISRVTFNERKGGVTISVERSTENDAYPGFDLTPDKPETVIAGARLRAFFK